MKISRFLCKQALGVSQRTEDLIFFPGEHISFKAIISGRDWLLMFQPHSGVLVMTLVLECGQHLNG